MKLLSWFNPQEAEEPVGGQVFVYISSVCSLVSIIREELLCGLAGS